jgi:2-dehydro-3-deoxyphosphogluconate aldolase/(4S)-4-hydroxy-2-oxoglutarate aldolase
MALDVAELAARLGSFGVVPVVTIDDAGDGPGLAEALIAGGLPVVEVTFRTAAAAGAIAAIRAAHPDVLLGAGTVLDPAAVERARDAGASFIVAPGYNAAVVARSRELGLPMIPGTLTPTEIERAVADGVTLVKLFPAEAAGGVAYLKAIAAPYRAVRFMPTGGVSPANLAAYLALPAVVACGGTWIAPPDAIREHRWADITAAATAARSIVVTARG